MKHAPKLDHASDGEPIARLGDCVAWFPRPEDTRFFYEAYAEIPDLTATIVYLRALLDEGALTKAQARNVALQAEVELLRSRQSALEDQLVALAKKAATAEGRARVLASAIFHKAKTL